MRKGEATRQRIIEEASPIFTQQGFAGCSMQRPGCRRRELEKGGIYRHFSSKEELAAEAFPLRAGVRGSCGKVRNDHLAEIPGAVEKLRRVVKLFVERRSTIPGWVSFDEHRDRGR